ncbi:hypothetical protein P4U62_15555, partial [Bacillus salipaludis]|nr:hypothetical protein [Bacillus salipaludis]
LERKARRLLENANAFSSCVGGFMKQFSVLREYGAGETPQERSDEEAPRHARGKRSAWSGNQQLYLTEKVFLHLLTKHDIYHVWDVTGMTTNGRFSSLI